jgi:pimeloyl-ACP methyl ester carboxylesterase
MSPIAQHYLTKRHPAQGKAKAKLKEETMERFLELQDGARLRAEIAGEGETILFVHADFLDGGMWRRTMERFSKTRRVACFDKRGYGASSPAIGPVCRRRELAAVIAALDLGPVHVVGCSNGGQSSLDFALESPELLRSLTLVNSTPSGFMPEGAPPPAILEMVAAFTRGDFKTASELQLRIWFDGPERPTEALDPRRLAARAEAAAMNKIPVDRNTYFIADASPLDPLDPPAIERLAEIRIPTLVVSGALDFAENRRASRILAEGIPGARFVEFADCAHVPPMEEPDRFAGLLEEFLGNEFNGR